MVNNDISPASILKELSTQFVGRRILYFPAIPSTMNEAKKAARAGAAEGTIIIAEEQTVGRGRLGRGWLSPRGNIALSLIIRPTLEQLPRLNMVASLAIVHCIENVTGLKAEIKWPNDILIGGKKVCGILVESALRGGSVDWAIIGIGINIDLAASLLSEFGATSLCYELGHEVSRLELLKCLLGELERFYLALRSGEPIHEEWRKRLVTLGKMVRLKSAGVVEEGYAEAVDEDGYLLLRRPDGNLIRIAGGEATLNPQS
jgi:BirA family biotin operon repressor/biotin-[acetyl-CoA-carboxylase] ligase